MKAFAILVALLVSGSVLAKGNENVEALEWVRHANPEADATKALKKGDIRLKAVYGYTLYIPGTKTEKFDYYKNKYGIAPIEGTSDSVESEKHGKLINLAVEYARQYNSIIIESAK